MTKQNLNVLDTARIIIYRCHEKGLEIFLLNDHLQSDSDIWGLPEADRNKIIAQLNEDSVIELNPVEDENGVTTKTYAIDGMKNSIPATYFHFKNQTDFYRGKVRDVYYFGDKLAMVTSDRISAFDHILKQAIPQKGKVLNGIATHFLHAAQSIVPTWLEASPHPNVSIGKLCKPIMLEMVVRGYLAGHSWREYQAGKRLICGVPMPDGMKEGQAFPTPIITPATKAVEGHDIDISKKDILAQNIVSADVLDKLYDYSLRLFSLGTDYAAKRGGDRDSDCRVFWISSPCTFRLIYHHDSAGAVTVV